MTLPIEIKSKHLGKFKLKKHIRTIFDLRKRKIKEKS